MASGPIGIVLMQVHHLSEPHACRVWRSINLTSLRDSSEDFVMHIFGKLFCAQLEEDCGDTVCGMELGYDQNILIEGIYIKHLNGVSY